MLKTNSLKATSLFFICTALYADDLTCPKDAFTKIYENGVWGRDAEGKGISGDGSRIEYAKTYLIYLQRFLRENSIKSVVDIGCGDWQLNRNIDFGPANYSGFDVYEGIVQRNTRRFGNEKIRFYEKDAINEDIPKAELLILKDVFQHWPIKAIHQFIPKIKNYKYAIIVNDYNNVNPFDNNFDLEDFSGWRTLDLERAPFSLKPCYVLEYQAGKTCKRLLMFDNSANWTP